MDSALDDFLKRFGDTDLNKFKIQNEKRLPVSSVTEGTGFKAQGLTDNLTGNNPLKDLTGNLEASEDEKENGLLKAKDIASKGLEALPSAISLIDNAKGNQFDTSADGSGPGKAGGAIIQGASQGMQLAGSIGLKDPISQGIAALGGGLISTFAHTGAMRKWRSNQVKANLQENALEKAQRQEEYARSEGLASLSNLKDLRKKQLGIIS